MLVKRIVACKNIFNRFPVIQPVSSKFAQTNLAASIFNRLRAIVRYWSEIATFSYPLAFNAPVGGVPNSHWNSGESLFLRKLESWGYQAVKMQFDDRLSRFDTIPALTDRQTDGRTDVQPIDITCAV